MQNVVICVLLNYRYKDFFNKKKKNKKTYAINKTNKITEFILSTKLKVYR